jgi:hypothetical protein
MAQVDAVFRHGRCVWGWFLYSLSHYLFLLARLWHVPSPPVWSLALNPILTSFAMGPGKALLWLTYSFVSNWFPACGLLIAVMREAVQTSETLINLYQSTQCYNPEDKYLRTHCCENLKSYEM